MRLCEVRRLTGPNLLLDGPAATIDVETDDSEGVAALLRRRTEQHLTALGWTAEVVTRLWDGGCTLAFAAPVDLLYAACEVLEAAWDDVLAGEDGPVRRDVVDAITASATEEADPLLLALLEEAEAHGVAGVWDDDDVSVGLGRGSLAWPRGEVPALDDIPWDEVHDVPVALVTGTNGKSTTVRMLATILGAAGRAPGNSSTDGIVVSGQLVESGDWSGPGGGRLVARDTRVGTMVLECARGGLLRRGLPVPTAAVSVVTNVAEDHLGEYGIETVDDLAHAKLVVAKAVATSGVLVVNADDPLLVAHAPRGPRTHWFGLDPTSEFLARALALGGAVWTVVGGALTRRDPAGEHRIAVVTDVPATHGGAAAHNVSNALAAAAAAHALDVADEHIAAGLEAFTADAGTNPGRANRYDVGGVTVIVDFAHNVHGVSAMANLAAALPAKRRLVLFSQAGDRPNDALDALAGAVADTHPDVCVVAEVPGYLRQRDPMEVPRRLKVGLTDRGFDPDAIHEAADAVVGTEMALDWAEPGDVLLLLVLEHRTEVADLLTSRGAQPA